MLSTRKSPLKVALGMSGGVDSSVCAHLLIEQGYDVTGVYLECWRAPGCRSEEDRKDALRVALELRIPFQVLDFKQAYKDKVVEYFFKEYEAGLTPNPDVMCNKEIKFGLFYEWAMAYDFDFVATGHYAQVLRINEAGKDRHYLQAAVDDHKDQTYFLYRVTEDHIAHTLFPIGHLTKPQVRIEAEKCGLHVATKKDSVGICFIGDINVHNFLKERLGEKSGDVVDTKGNVIGSHKGLWFYTIGQRHGFTLEASALIKESDGKIVNKHIIPPFYVIKKRADKNQLMVGFGAETYQDNFTVRDLHFINGEVSSLENCLVRIRHTGKLIEGSFNAKTNRVLLKEAIQGIAEGQSVVFYQEKNEYLCCLGGGVVSSLE